MKNFQSVCFLLLTGCIFDGSGWGNNPTITDSGTFITCSTTMDVSPLTSSTSTTSDITSSSGTTFPIIDSSTGGSTTEQIDLTTGFESTSTGFETSGSSSSGFESSSGGESNLCGDCILQRAEECDPCVYSDLMKSESYCIMSDCLVGFNKPLSFRADSPLPGMNTPTYDQEEADLLCKIYLHSPKAKASSYSYNNLGYTSNRLWLFNTNYFGKGILLKSAAMYYPNKPFYLFEYSEFAFNQNLDPVFHAFNCMIT